ncbi:unnamed protein product [Peniophora sp. CBMAI 1063]|nr:unnamed protein product [Peniophora sp. CBMAI 1063]
MLAPGPIMNLKGDILLELFALIATTDVPHVLPWVDPGPLKYHLGWVRLTHVCRLWRVILVNEMPQLWADAVCRMPPAQNTMLGRARGRPLTLNLNISLGQYLNLPSGHVHHERLYNFALANIAQAEAFHALHATLDRDWPLVLADRRVPLLKYLELKRQPRGDDDSRPVLKSFDAPNLLWVRLQDIAMTFTSTSIRHLYIFGHQIFCNPDWSILDVLSRLPLLEWLELDQQPYERLDYTRYEGPPITLERLKLRRLYGNAKSDMVTFAKHLPISEQMRSQMRELFYAHIVTDRENWEDDFVAAFGPSLDTPSFDGMLVCDEGDKTLVCTFPVCEKPELAPGGCRQHADLAILIDDEPSRVRIGLAALRHIDASHIKQLAYGLEVPGEYRTETVETLRAFSAVTDFAALTGDVLSLLSAREDGFVLFPNLESLHAGMEAPSTMEELHAWWDMLARIISERSAAAIFIRRIRLADGWKQVVWNQEFAVVDAMRKASVELLGVEVHDDRHNIVRS